MTRRTLVGTAFSALLLAGPLALLVQPASAKPAHRVSLADHYGRFLGPGLNNCGTCHVAAGPPGPVTTLADFAHNPFGDRLRRKREELAAAGERADLGSRLRAVAAEDSDGDGVPNEVELLTGHHPGDPKDHPTVAELKRFPKLRARFTTFLNTYRWRPFEPVAAPPVPKVRNKQWVRNPIDAFIAAEHEQRGLKPRPEAPKLVLLRRVTLDLTGLSPTPEEQRAFLADRSPDAYERLVDRLLASPQYGERWGRQWMDVWRYSDWTGYGAQVRDSKPHIWRWRDWIVESLNSDKGYDRMVQEMLAGDELAPTDPDALRGTGFLVRNYKLLSREKWLQDTVDHTGQAFLGLTVGCARCHDHMYDPLTQKEYYRLRAIFEPHEVRTDWVAGEFDTEKDGLPRAFDAKPEAPTFLYVRGDERQPVKEEPLAPGIPEALGGKFTVTAVELPLPARAPERQPHVVAALRAYIASEVEAARKAVAAAKEPGARSLAELKLRAAEASQAATLAVLKTEALEDAGQKASDAWKQAATETLRLQREQAVAEATVTRAIDAAAVAKAEANAKPGGDKLAAILKAARTKLETTEKALAEAEQAAKAPPSTDYKPRAAAVYPAASTGRRLAFARWLTARENPLTARVAVNHIWLRHFGRGLVPSAENLGRNGVPPTHPALLDWLAANFMGGSGGERSNGAMEYGSNGSGLRNPNTPSLQHSITPWSMKQLHRLMVTSATYRQSSASGPVVSGSNPKSKIGAPTPVGHPKSIDPDNHYLWRMNSRRMDAEIVRDNVLYVTGQLDPKMGGPDIDHNLGLTVKRRSIYFRHAAEKEMEFLKIFDGPNVTECYLRKETVVPQQALALANSELALTQARLLARAVAKETEGDAKRFVTTAYERVLARPPRPAELAECVKFLEEQPSRIPTAADGAVKEPADAAKPAADPALRAKENLILVLLNHNDFVTIR